MRTIRIADREIGDAHEPFLIAEVGLNHNGDIDRALRMIEIAAITGVDAVKFQTFKAEGVCDASQIYTYWSQGQEITEPRINIFRRAELPAFAWPLLKAECAKQNVLFFSTPQNPEDVDTLLALGVPAIKIGSDDLTNRVMLEYVGNKVKVPVILSCGMSNAADINGALHILGVRGVIDVAVLVCTSQYPCPPEEANLARIRTLRRDFTNPIGFSDHTEGSVAASIATALGACIFEKHFTLSHDLPGPDHHFSAMPVGLALWCRQIREARMLLGTGIVEPSAAEMEQKRLYQRTEVAA